MTSPSVSVLQRDVLLCWASFQLRVLRLHGASVKTCSIGASTERSLILHVTVCHALLGHVVCWYAVGT